jgi:ketosteroid isomerase-like protein
LLERLRLWTVLPRRQILCERDTGRDVSEENVEIAKRGVAAFNRTFAHDTGEFFEFVHPEAEWIPITAVMEGTRYSGQDEVRQFIEEMKRDWDVFETRVEEYRDLGDDRVLALGTWRARGRGSGIELDFQQASWLMQFRDGKVIRMQTFTEREKAYEAAGIQE